MLERTPLSPGILHATLPQRQIQSYLELEHLFLRPVARLSEQLLVPCRVGSRCLFVCLFGEGARARSIVAEASGMAQKIVARTSFEATRDLARPDNTALLGAAPLP